MIAMCYEYVLEIGVVFLKLFVANCHNCNRHTRYQFIVIIILSNNCCVNIVENYYATTGSSLSFTIIHYIFNLLYYDFIT